MKNFSKKIETVIFKILNVLDMSDINNLKENNVEIYKILKLLVIYEGYFHSVIDPFCL